MSNSAMLTSRNRYTFQPQHFKLSHDVTLDNIQTPLDDCEMNFPVFEPIDAYENQEPSSTAKWSTAHRSTTSARYQQHQQQQQQQRTSIDSTRDKLQNLSSSPLIGFNSLLEVRNHRNAAKSTSGLDDNYDVMVQQSPEVKDESRRGGVATDRTPACKKRIRPEVAGSTGKGAEADGTRGWRIEDFASSGNERVRYGLNSFSTATNRSDNPSIVSRFANRNSSYSTTAIGISSASSPSPSNGNTRSTTKTTLDDARIPVRFMQSVLRSQPVQSAVVAAIEASNADDDDDMTFTAAEDSSYSRTFSVTSPVHRRLPEIPRQDAATATKGRRQSTQSPSKSKAAAMSLAEELQAVFAADTTPRCGGLDFRQTLVLPLGVHQDGDHGAPSTCRGDSDSTCGGLSQFLINVSELGTPEYVDPVNKYRDVVCDMAYGCIYSALGDAHLKADKRTDDIPQPSTVSRSSSSWSGTALDDCGIGETSDVTSASVTRLPLSMTNSLEQHVDDNKAPVTSRVVECLPDVIATTVGALRTDRESRDIHRGSGVETDLISRTSSQSSKKSSVYCGHLDRTTSSLESSRSSSPSRLSSFPTSPLPGSCSSLEYDLDELDATHRGCHRFVPRHPEELAIEISDPIYVELEEDDLWCEGINLRTRQRGIFPTAYATDLSILDDVPRSRKFFLKFLGSIEVSQHKGNDVLVQAINKLFMMRQPAWHTNPPPLCCLEINEFGIKMTERTKKKDSILTSDESTLAKKLARLLAKSMETTSNIDTLFSLKNICFCGYHPKNERYLGIITKHPLAMRFACHIFQGEKSTRTVAEVIGDSFQRFYQEYLAVLNPTEDIYLE